jgi:hypothetical protein
MTILDKCGIGIGTLGVVACLLTQNWTAALWALAYTVQTLALIVAKGARGALS